MAGNAFGFSPYPQRPTVDPRTVGQALVSRAQASMPMQGGPGGPMSPMPMQDMATGRPMAPMPMGGGGEDDLLMGRDGGDQFEDSAIQAMRHERNRRVGMELEQGQQRVPANHDAQLRRLGMSDAEIRLLRQAGGIK
jgi:hypothetical protein